MDVFGGTEGQAVVFIAVLMYVVQQLTTWANSNSRVKSAWPRTSGTGKTGGAGKGCSYAISFRTLTFLHFDEPKPSTQGLHRHNGRRTFGKGRGLWAC